jgi:hypothetical protein
MMLDILEWYGAIAAVVAAALVASNLGDRITGWAFVLFVSSSIALIAWGFMSEDADGIGWQNICLLVINGWGVWRYLVQRPGKREPGPAQGAP